MNAVNEQCGDNRFEVIQRAKEHLIEATNIESSPDEMKVLDSFLFRAWQMEWLRKYDPTLKAGKDTNVSSKWVSVDERLPEKPGEYVAMIKGAKNPTCLFFDVDAWIDEVGEPYTVTHWREMPEPPKGVQ